MATTTATEVRHRRQRDTIAREEVWSQVLLFVGPTLAFVVALVVVR